MNVKLAPCMHFVLLCLAAYGHTGNKLKLDLATSQCLSLVYLSLVHDCKGMMRDIILNIPWVVQDFCLCQCPLELISKECLGSSFSLFACMHYRVYLLCMSYKLQIMQTLSMYNYMHMQSGYTLFCITYTQAVIPGMNEKTSSISP